MKLSHKKREIKGKRRSTKNISKSKNLIIKKIFVISDELIVTHFLTLKNLAGKKKREGGEGEEVSKITVASKKEKRKKKKRKKVKRKTVNLAKGFDWPQKKKKERERD